MKTSPRILTVALTHPFREEASENAAPGGRPSASVSVGLFRLIPLAAAVAAVAGCTYFPFESLWRQGQPQEQQAAECATDFDCSLVFNERNLCRDDGICVEDETCTNSDLCYPLACNTTDQQCRTCSDVAPCMDGTVCGNDGTCRVPIGIQAIPDFELDIVTAFESGGCVSCHNSEEQSESDLVFDVSPDDLYRQLLLPGRERVIPGVAVASTIVTKPRREDPPNHIVDVWEQGSPEVALLVRWVVEGAARQGECRSVRMSSGVIADCYESYLPENYCTDYIQNGDETRIRWECPECDERLGTPPQGVTCD